MGTNFYWDGMGDEQHIGKRSAAGRWCWDCDVTLKVGGRKQVHLGGDWLDECPLCARPFVPSDVAWSGPVGVELGFSEPQVARPTGVGTCSSFTWAQHPEHVATRCEEHADEEVIVDEYGRRLTGRAFLDMLRSNCPLQFTDMIGRWFA